MSRKCLGSVYALVDVCHRREDDRVERAAGEALHLGRPLPQQVRRGEDEGRLERDEPAGDAARRVEDVSQRGRGGLEAGGSF